MWGRGLKGRQSCIWHCPGTPAFRTTQKGYRVQLLQSWLLTNLAFHDFLQNLCLFRLLALSKAGVCVCALQMLKWKLRHLAIYPRPNSTQGQGWAWKHAGVALRGPGKGGKAKRAIAFRTATTNTGSMPGCLPPCQGQLCCWASGCQPSPHTHTPVPWEPINLATAKEKPS